jgi:hypothetical protein
LPSPETLPQIEVETEMVNDGTITNECPDAPSRYNHIPSFPIDAQLQGAQLLWVLVLYCLKELKQGILAK